MEKSAEQKPEFIDTEIKLNVSEDNMKVFLTCRGDYSKSDELTDRILKHLHDKKITGKPDLTLIGKSIDEAIKTGEEIKDVLIVEGRPPVMPVDGKIEWMGNYFDKGYYIDPETQRIDYKQKLEDRSVNKGDLLVKVTPAQNGREGRNVFGKALVVRSPQKAYLKGGPNVVWVDAESGFKATCAGRVKLRGSTLDVDPIYRIPDGIGNESGNVKHNGQVVVDGDVEADFKVEATGDIEVRGLVYASDIECGGDLSAKEGINGNLSKRIHVTGNILAKYIHNASIKCGGDIGVSTEIFNSFIEAEGEINCSRGRIIGGEILATKGMVVDEAGSKGDTNTVLVAGVDRNLQDKLKRNSEEMNRLKEMLKKLQAGYRKYKANLQLLSNEQKEAMTEISHKIQEGEDEVERIEKENKAIVVKIRENSNALIKIKNIIHPGVVLRIGDARYIVDQTLAGPIYVGQDRYSREIKMTSKPDDFETENMNNNQKSEQVNES